MKKLGKDTTKNVKFFGSQPRFKDLKKTKSLQTLIVPGPGNYNMIAVWWGKDKKKQDDV